MNQSNYSKTDLAVAFAMSTAHNPRNLECHWYGVWGQVLSNLTKDQDHLIVQSQFRLYYYDADEDDGLDLGDTSLSSIGEMVAGNSRISAHHPTVLQCILWFGERLLDHIP